MPRHTVLLLSERSNTQGWSKEAADFPAPQTPRRNKRLEKIVTFVLVPILLIYSVFLPPLSLGNRLFSTNRHSVTADKGGLVPGPNGVTLTVPAGAVTKRTRIGINALDSAALAALKPDKPEALAVKSLPADVIVRGPLYGMDIRGVSPAHADLEMPTPADLIATEKADLYGWDGSAWRWLPSQVSDDDTTIRASLDPVPSMIMVGQSTPAAPRIAVNATLRRAWPMVPRISSDDGGVAPSRLSSR